MIRIGVIGTGMMGRNHARINSEFPITPEQALKNLKICEEIKKGLEWQGFST